MSQPFIRNHQYNWIKKQADLLQRAIRTVSDPKVVEAVRYSAQTKLMDVFPDATELQKQMLEKLSTLQTTEEFQRYEQGLEPYLTEFAPVTEKRLQKLFPKNKKLKLPDLTAVDFRRITYLGWTDIATNKLFLVYDRNGQLVGIEGKFTPLNRSSGCFLCNRHGEAALFSAISKSRPANASPDYYKAFGNYVCLDSDACNKNITDVAALESFISNIVG